VGLWRKASRWGTRQDMVDQVALLGSFVLAQIGTTKL
jgi:hypothetical protein